MTEKLILQQPARPDSSEAMALLNYYLENSEEVEAYLNQMSNEAYLFWDKVKHQPPILGLSVEKSWLLVRLLRQMRSQSTPIVAENNRKFTWYRTPSVDEKLRKIDMYAGGSFLHNQPEPLMDQQKYITRGILEEAIASSQLEGADTSRRYAKQMIAENIKPRNKSDWMILNNYKALLKIDQEYSRRDLSRSLLLEVQEMLTKNSLDYEKDAGRFRTDEDDIGVYLNDEILVHKPPKADFMMRELDSLIDFANDNTMFIHPVVKATMLHFWLGYLHPFCDGNGRTARAIFYWYMIKNDYWAMLYLPLSTLIKRSPVQYMRAYVYAEQDGLDFSYFFDYIIRKIIASIDEFNSFVDETVLENQKIGELINREIKTNNRQNQMIKYLLASPGNYISIASPLVKINEVEIFGNDGRLVKRANIKNETDKIDVKSLPVGTYFVRTYDNGNFIKSMKFIKQ